jgi:hypothetical protein
MAQSLAQNIDESFEVKNVGTLKRRSRCMESIHMAMLKYRTDTLSFSEGTKQDQRSRFQSEYRTYIQN